MPPYEIIDMHSEGKLDAPSGTAIELAEEIAEKAHRTRHTTISLSILYAQAIRRAPIVSYSDAWGRRWKYSTMPTTGDAMLFRSM